MLSHTGCAVGQVWLGAAPRENAAHRIRTLRRGAASQTRRWPTRDIRLSGFHAHQRQDPRRRVHHPPQNVAQEIPSQTRRTQRDAIAAMSRRPGAGRRVAAKCVSRLVSVLCCPRQWRTPAAVPRCDPSHVAAQPPASQPTRPPPDLGKVLQALQALASDSEDPSPLSQREVCMSTSKVRTVCGSSARTDLCGGRSERSSLPRWRVFNNQRSFTCPLCEATVTEGFYCISCGYISPMHQKPTPLVKKRVSEFLVHYVSMHEPLMQLPEDLM